MGAYYVGAFKAVKDWYFNVNTFQYIYCNYKYCRHYTSKIEKSKNHGYA